MSMAEAGPQGLEDKGFTIGDALPAPDRDERVVAAGAASAQALHAALGAEGAEIVPTLPDASPEVSSSDAA